jgi:serine-type D-Ala-D-Ala carboxypeptidase/endopeptidase (penicillin-binding protein 4)
MIVIMNYESLFRSLTTSYLRAKDFQALGVPGDRTNQSNKDMKRIVFTFLLFISVCAQLVAQSKISAAIRQLVEEPSLKNGAVGVAVIDVESGTLIAGHDSNKSLTPASSLKVMTTGAALALLGPDFRFETKLEYDGQIDSEGTLSGNLYLTGMGDPTLGSGEFEIVPDLEKTMQMFCSEIQKAGIKKIEGQVVGDASYFGTQACGRTWAFEDLGNYYGAGAYGLNILENLFYVRLQQKRSLGSNPGVVAIEPAIPNLLLINELRSAEKGSGDNAYIFGGPNTYTAYIRGTIPIGFGTFTIKGAIPDPPFFAAHSLLHALEKNGVTTSRKATTLEQLDLEKKEKQKRIIIYTHQSPTLKDIVRQTNMKSVNLFSEAMLRILGKQKKGEGTPEAGIEVMLDFWKMKGLQTDGLFLEDGSGLSPYNAVTTQQLASAMRLIYRDEILRNAFYDSLPVAGKSGALSNRLKGSKAENNLRAKSGGLNRVRSFTGLVKSADGKMLAFSIIINNYSGTSGKVLARMEELMKSLAE